MSRPLFVLLITYNKVVAVAQWRYKGIQMSQQMDLQLSIIVPFGCDGGCIFSALPTRRCTLQVLSLLGVTHCWTKERSRKAE